MPASSSPYPSWRSSQGSSRNEHEPRAPDAPALPSVPIARWFARSVLRRFFVASATILDSRIDLVGVDRRLAAHVAAEPPAGGRSAVIGATTLAREAAFVAMTGTAFRRIAPCC